MKKLIGFLILVSTISLFSGCGNTKKTDASVGQTGQQQVGQGAFNGQNRQANQTPEGKLQMSIMSLTRIQRSEAPLTKDQKDKLLVLLKDVQAKDTIDEEYSNKEVSAINAILTDNQKALLTQRPGNMRNGNNGNNNETVNPNGNGVPNPNANGTGKANGNGNANRPRNGNGNGSGTGNADGNGNWNGNNGGNAGNNGFDMKSICERAISALKE